MMDDILTLVLVSNNKYLNYAETILKSISVNCEVGYLKIHLHLVDISEKNMSVISRMNQACSHPIEFSYSHPKLSDKRKIGKKFESAIYSANIRVKVLRDLMLRGDPYLFYLDVDSLVLGDLHGLLEVIKSGDVIFHTDREIEVENLRYKSGGIGINNNSRSLAFFEEYHAQMAKDQYMKWAIDQYYLRETYLKMVVEEHICQYVDLPARYLDWHFHDNSEIWTGKGKRKKLNEKYVKEYQKYSKMTI